MATSITKSGTNIAETSTEELQKLSQKAGVVPKSPAGAASIGANESQAKMAGTPAQKASRIDGVSASSPTTLQQAQRITQPAPEAVTAPEKLDRMKQLGSLNTQVEGLVQGYMQQLQAQQAALSLNTQTLDLVDEGRRLPLEAALNEYKTALTEQQKEAAVIKAGQALGRPLTQAEMTSYFAGAPDQLGNLAKAVTPDTVTLNDLNLGAAGVNIPAIAADLGVSEDELSGLTLPQLNQKIEEIKQAEFAQSESAQAEALSAVGNRATQLQGERQAIGQSGRMGYEAQFDKLQEGIQNADVVNVAGQAMTLDKLLSDERLSDIISGAALSASALKQLRETEPELATWVDNYRTALLQLSKDAGLVAQDVADRQLEAEKLKENVSSDLFESMFGARSDILSKEELDALKSEMSGSALWQAVNTDSDLRTRLELNPSAVEGLKGLDAAGIQTLMAATKAAEANPVLGDLAGFTPGGILTPAQADFVNQWRDELQALPPAIASDRRFQEMVKSGELNEQAAMLLVDAPELWDEYKAEEAAARELSRVQTEDDFMEMVTGDPSFGMDDFNEAMTMLRAWATTGNQDALNYYTRLQRGLTGPDGVLDMNDVQKALQDMAASKASIGDVLGGKEGVVGLLRKLTADLSGSVQFEKDAYADPKNKATTLAIDYLKNDQRIDAEEMAHLLRQHPDVGTIKELLTSPWIPNKLELADIYNAQVRQQANSTLTAAYEQIRRLGGVSDFRATDSDVQMRINPSTIYDKPEQLAAYRGHIQAAINQLKEAGDRAFEDESYAQASSSLQRQLQNLDMMDAMARIQKEFMPAAKYESFAGNGSTGSLLEGLQKLQERAPGASLLEPGLSADQIYERFRAAFKPHQSSGSAQQSGGKGGSKPKFEQQRSDFKDV